MVKTLKKSIVTTLIMVLLIILISNLGFTQLLPINKISEIEKLLYGQVHEEKKIKERFASLEQILYQQKFDEETLIKRSDRIINFFFPQNEENSSLILLLNTIEWSLNNKISSEPVLPRVKNLMEKVYDKNLSDIGLVSAVKSLSSEVLSDGVVPASEVLVPADTEINISLLDKISSDKAEAGDEYGFEVTEELKIQGKLVVPQNSRGTLEVVKVTKAGRLAQNGDLKLQVNDLLTIDGSKLPLSISLNQDKNHSKELAVGAGLLGTIVLNNPIGLAVGYFVKGQEQVLPANTVLTVKTLKKKKVNGLEISK